MVAPYFVSDYEKNLFETRYRDPANPDETTWEDLFDRVSTTVSKVALDGFGPPDLHRDLIAAQWTNLMSIGAFIPSSPQLWNYGADRRFPRNGSSCFTGRMGDSLVDFRAADADAESVYVASGGMGLLLNDVRPRGCDIRHCSEGAMGSMCDGGPAKRVEGTTGYITGAGRARGALMIQQSSYHPDVIEFITAKRPTSLGFMDDWRANAWSVLGWGASVHDGAPRDELIQFIIERFYSKWVHRKEWPTGPEFYDDLNDLGYNGVGAISKMVTANVVRIVNDRIVPHVTDWNSLDDDDNPIKREANRDWRLPLQNCNMSVRNPDEFYEAVLNNSTWVLHWFSDNPPKDDEMPNTVTDALTPGEMFKYTDGTMFIVSEDMTSVESVDAQEWDDGHYRYGVVITTWEGLRTNMRPNQNQWRDTDYARLYRTVLLPAMEGLTGPIHANQLWDMMCEGAWNHADPGIVNESTYEQYQPVDTLVYGPRHSNPCHEYLNSPGGSCNLASLNLRWCTETMSMDWLDDHVPMWDTHGLSSIDNWSVLKASYPFSEVLEQVRSTSVHILEYMAHSLEYNVAPVEYIHEMTKNHFRTVGVGMMGLAEAMMHFHIKYDSPCGVRFAATMMSEIALSCWEASFALAADGWPKPIAWNQERMASIFDARSASAVQYDLPSTHVRRWSKLALRVRRGEHATHTTVTSVAPTGTISQVASWLMTRAASNGTLDYKHVNSGGEPNFGWSVDRQDNSGKTKTLHDMWMTPEHRNKPWMVTASDVSPEYHIKVQAALCAFCCMSVSKTVNMPNTATIEDVKETYWMAWKLGIPGTAVYRDSSKPMQVLTALECPSGECTVDLPELTSDGPGTTIQMGVAK